MQQLFFQVASTRDQSDLKLILPMGIFFLIVFLAAIGVGELTVRTDSVVANEVADPLLIQGSAVTTPHSRDLSNGMPLP